MVEASVVMPVVIMTVILMLRLFAFYLEVLSAQVESHAAAAQAWSSYDKAYVSKYKERKTVAILSGGLLNDTFSKEIVTEAYLMNDDIIIRTGELFSEE